MCLNMCVPVACIVLNLKLESQESQIKELLQGFFFIPSGPSIPSCQYCSEWEQSNTFFWIFANTFLLNNKKIYIPYSFLFFCLVR